MEREIMMMMMMMIMMLMINRLYLLDSVRLYFAIVNVVIIKRYVLL